MYNELIVDLIDKASCKAMEKITKEKEFKLYLEDLEKIIDSKINDQSIALEIKDKIYSVISIGTDKMYKEGIKFGLNINSSLRDGIAPVKEDIS